MRTRLGQLARGDAGYFDHGRRGGIPKDGEAPVFGDLYAVWIGGAARLQESGGVLFVPIRYRRTRRNVEGLDGSIAIRDDHDVSMQGHAIDDSGLQAGNGNVIHEGESAAGLDLKGSDGIRVGEAGVQEFSVQRQTDAVRSACVTGRAESGACHLQSADVDSDYVAGPGVGGVDALFASVVEHGYAVRRKIAAADAKASG